MKTVGLTVNGRAVSSDVPPRMHLADLLRESMNLTGTHLRCEQGACGACTVLIDGQPARSCITYAVMCEGASVQTIEGLENDVVITALRRAFSEEHGLQCGYCTPGMLVTARDIILRLPDADQKRIRTELSGNLCRCTGYAGIVRAVSRVLRERRDGSLGSFSSEPGPLGPVGARGVQPTDLTPTLPPRPDPQITEAGDGAIPVGLAGRKPNVEIHHTFRIARPRDEVWNFFGDFARVVKCLPGASLTGQPADGALQGKMAVKIGPITATFSGRANVTRDNANYRGTITGGGSDQGGGSRATGEVSYALVAAGFQETEIFLTVGALLSGALAQFSRSGIVEDLVARITTAFAKNIEATLSGHIPDGEFQGAAPLKAGTLLRQVFAARLKAFMAKLVGRPR